jgi:hypothetical protein
MIGYYTFNDDSPAIDVLADPYIWGRLEGVVRLHQTYPNTISARFTDDEVGKVKVGPVLVSCTVRTEAVAMCNLGHRVRRVCDLSFKLIGKNLARIIEERCDSPGLRQFAKNASLTTQSSHYRRV